MDFATIFTFLFLGSVFCDIRNGFLNRKGKGKKTRLSLYVFIAFIFFSLFMSAYDRNKESPEKIPAEFILTSLPVALIILVRRKIKNRKTAIKSPAKIEKQKNPAESNSRTIVSQTDFSNGGEFHLHSDLEGLLWFADGEYQNIDLKENRQTIRRNGMTFYFYDYMKEEPSLIFTKMPIVIPDDIRDIPRPQYFPRYSELIPEQKGVYAELLKNPYNTDIDIGYVFILYYGLERHLLYGNWQKAVDVIKKLRKVHKNDSFQAYSAYALIYTAFYRNIPELAEELIKNLDSLAPYSRLFFSFLFDIPFSAKSIINMCTTFGFKNKNYIKKFPELFEKTLAEKIREKTGKDYVKIAEHISMSEVEELEQHKIPAFANLSLRLTTITIPYLYENEKLRLFFYNLLADTHETVKAISTGKARQEPKMIEEKSAEKEDTRLDDFISELKRQMKAEKLSEKNLAHNKMSDGILNFTYKEIQIGRIYFGKRSSKMQLSKTTLKKEHNVLMPYFDVKWLSNEPFEKYLSSIGIWIEEMKTIDYMKSEEEKELKELGLK